MKVKPPTKTNTSPRKRGKRNIFSKLSSFFSFASSSSSSSPSSSHSTSRNLIRMGTRIWFVIVCLSIIIIIRQTIRLRQATDAANHSHNGNNQKHTIFGPGSAINQELDAYQRNKKYTNRQEKELAYQNQKWIAQRFKNSNIQLNNMKKAYNLNTKTIVDDDDEEEKDKNGNSNKNQQKEMPKIPTGFRSLPSWLTDGSRTIAKQRIEANRIQDDDDYNDIQQMEQQQQQQQYIKPECEDFDYSVLYPKHGCQINMDTGLIYCTIEQLRIDTSKIKCSMGGEPLIIPSSSSSAADGEGRRTTTTTSTSSSTTTENIHWNTNIMGRPENVEFPIYQKGAFSTTKPPKFFVPEGRRKNLHYLADVLNAMTYPTKQNDGVVPTDCSVTIPGTTMLITRYEYVNLYHTMTDWWNAYSVFSNSLLKQRNEYQQKQEKQKQQQSKQQQQQQLRQGVPSASSSTTTTRTNKMSKDDQYIHSIDINQTQIIFLDGHAHGNLDQVWETLFGPYAYVQHLPALVGATADVDADADFTGKQHTATTVCLERAVFVPPGYYATIYPKHSNDVFGEILNCPNHIMAKKFRNFVLKTFSSQSIPPSSQVLSSSSSFSTFSFFHNSDNKVDDDIVIDLKAMQPTTGKIVIIDRQPYISHPRSVGTGILKNQSPGQQQEGIVLPEPKIQRVIGNLQSLQTSLRQISGVTEVEIVQLDALSTFTEQLYTIRSAQFVIGYHGAGLTHIMFMEPKNSYMIEYCLPSLSGGSCQDFFQILHEWTNVPHYIIELQEGREEDFDTDHSSSTTILSKYDIQRTVDYVTRSLK